MHVTIDPLFSNARDTGAASRARPAFAAAAVSLALLAPAPAQSQATVREDGQWRFAIGAGASFASGNSDSTTVNLTLDGVRATSFSKASVYSRMLYGRSDDTTTAEQLVLGGRYDRDLAARWFGFGRAELLRDRPANLSSRSSVGAGIGYHLIRTERTRWDLLAGLGYTYDRYRDTTTVADELRDRYGYAELFLAEESTHELTATTSLRQRIAVWPNLRDTGEFRAELDAGVAVAVNDTMNLTAGLQYRYVSDPGTDLEKGDVLFVTGLSVKLD